jgi:hypothetical protein
LITLDEPLGTEQMDVPLSDYQGPRDEVGKVSQLPRPGLYAQGRTNITRKKKHKSTKDLLASFLGLNKAKKTMGRGVIRVLIVMSSTASSLGKALHVGCLKQTSNHSSG